MRAVLFRERYRGVIIWNRTRKRDRWGQRRRTTRAEADWVRVEAPALEIIDDARWDAAHRRLGAARQLYLKGTNGRRFGRPPVGSPSKYLLTNLAQCGVCGSSMKVRTRSHRHFRAKFYGCSGYHDRGRTVCPNGADVPMEDADLMVLEAVLDDVSSAGGAVVRGLSQGPRKPPDGRARTEPRALVTLRPRSRSPHTAIAANVERSVSLGFVTTAPPTV